MSVASELVKLRNAPGTHFTFDYLDYTKSRGVISARVKNDAATIDDFAKFRSTFPSSWNTVPLKEITCVGDYGGDAILWARYEYADSTENAQRWVRRVETIEGTDAVLLWNHPQDASKLNDDGKPRRVLAQLRTIRWGNVEYSSILPIRAAAGHNRIGTVNSNPVAIGGIAYPARSLLYQGPIIEHTKRGAFDRWAYLHSALFRVVYMTTGGEVLYWKESFQRQAEAGRTGGPFTRDIYPARNWAGVWLESRG